MSLCPSVSLPSAAETPDIRRWTGAAPNDCPVKICCKSLWDKEVMVQEFNELVLSPFVWGPRFATPNPGDLAFDRNHASVL